MKLIRKNNKKGFTLVELIVVIAIIAILALILIPAISGYVAKADKAALESSARALHTKAIMYVSEKGYDEEGLKDVLDDELGNKFKLKGDKVNADKNAETFDFTVTFNNDKKTDEIKVTQSGIEVKTQTTP